MNLAITVCLIFILYNTDNCFTTNLKSNKNDSQMNKTNPNEIILPQPKFTGKYSLEECILRRRSVRKYINKPLSLEQISQILWSAQGITDKKKGGRTAPSAGALYPLELYVFTHDGIYHYLPETHKLIKISNNDAREQLMVASFGQYFINQAGISVVICAVYKKVTEKYGKRGIRYVDIEAGHTAQNIHLQAIALGLDSVPVGAFDDESVKKLLNLDKDEQPIYIIPVGYADK